MNGRSSGMSALAIVFDCKSPAMLSGDTLRALFSFEVFILQFSRSIDFLRFPNANFCYFCEINDVTYRKIILSVVEFRNCLICVCLRQEFKEICNSEQRTFFRKYLAMKQDFRKSELNEMQIPWNNNWRIKILTRLDVFKPKKLFTSVFTNFADPILSTSLNCTLICYVFNTSSWQFA